MQKEDIVFETLDRLKNEIRKVIIGQDKVTEQLITGLLADGHILIEGVPGIAKTLIAKCISKSVSAGFSRIQFTPDLMPSDLVGTMVFDSVKSEFYFRKGPLFSNIILIDEINRAPAKTQSALFEVMEERQISVDGTTYPMTPPFIVYATQNPIEQEGTYRLPEAQLDRFLFKVLIDYPADNEEVQILMNYQSASASDKLSLINPVVAPSDLEVLRNKVESIYIDEKIAGYVAAIVIATRKSRDIVLGGSPRASLSIMRSAKAHAVLQGRPYVIPDDIKAVALPALRHRIILSPEKEMEGLKPDDLIRMLIDRIEVPR
ncbi:MAG: MoxR family ATPase [Ignavibacteriaceae bacterium]|nr:MoxR family ATPase [Ignavibacteriaceae bacterium]